MSSAESATQPHAEPFLRKMRQIVLCLESVSESTSAIISSRRSSTASANSPNAAATSAAAAARTPTRGSTSRLSSVQINSGNEDTPTYSNSNAGLHLRQVHGRLTVAREELDSVPQALPTDNFYQRFPRAVGPLANVVVTAPEKLPALMEICDVVEVVKARSLRDVARNRLCPEDIHQGGFFLYQPKGQVPQYFKLREVSPTEHEYGTSSYIQV